MDVAYEAHGDDSVFDVDLNSVRDGNMITTLIDHAATLPLVPRVAMGDWVWVRDEQMVMYRAIVKKVEPDGRRIRLQIDWSATPRASLDWSSETMFGRAIPPAVPSGVTSAPSELKS